MSFQCIECETHWWSSECSYNYDSAGRTMVCPDCEVNVRKVIGPVESQILYELAEEEPLSGRQLASRLDLPKDIIDNALRCLLDFGFLGTTSDKTYKRGSKGREFTD